ncbi:MAG: nucleotidyl transferase AbiEii/AbiGii toxin family protein [Spirochaetia bacterium]
MDYSSLYAVQDQILDALFSGETTFYLTGGTCLHRFYFHKRHSDDLDLFTSETALYREDVRAALQHIKNTGLEYETVVDTRDFVRIHAAGVLQVDFVNDRVYRHGASQMSPQGYPLDNVTNIFANKICAVLGRDEPKDIFDLCTLMQVAEVSPANLLPIVQRKCAMDLEDLEHRLVSFPVDLLGTLAVTDVAFLESMSRDYRQIVGDLLESLA